MQTLCADPFVHTLYVRTHAHNSLTPHPRDSGVSPRLASSRLADTRHTTYIVRVGEHFQAVGGWVGVCVCSVREESDFCAHYTYVYPTTTKQTTYAQGDGRAARYSRHHPIGSTPSRRRLGVSGSHHSATAHYCQLVSILFPTGCVPLRPAYPALRPAYPVMRCSLPFQPITRTPPGWKWCVRPSRDVA